jgi:hypothetical protein
MGMSMKLIRVFPRKTTATPDDADVRFMPPTLFDEADEIHISVSFEWDKKIGEQLERAWRYVGKTFIGGPAFGNRGGEFEPGKYLKYGYVITSRGCPNKCWFCQAWKNEGELRELEVKNGWIVQDNNLLATSRKHQVKVFEMLLRQSEKARFTGGFEATRFTEWHRDWMIKLKPMTILFAYDSPEDYEPLRNAAKLCEPLKSHSVRAYVLIGYPKDTIENAEKRLQQMIDLGIMPHAMLYNRRPEKEWRRFQREWANSIIVGSKMHRVSKKKGG